MMQFAKEFPDSKIVSQLATKLFRSNYTIFVVSRKWSVLGIEHCKPY